MGAVSGIWENIRSAASNAWGGIKNLVVDIASNLKQSVVDAFHNLVSGIGTALSGLGSVVSSGFRGAISFITSLPSEAWGWGADFINGMVDGIKSTIGNIVSAVSNVASTIRSYLHFSVPDVGPLTDYESWMPDFMGGLAIGINKNKSLVTSQIKALSGEMVVRPSMIQGAPILKNIHGSNREVSENNALNKLIIVIQMLIEKIDINTHTNNLNKLDRDDFIDALVKSLTGLGIYLDKQLVGTVIAPVVNAEFGKFDRRKT